MTTKHAITIEVDEAALRGYEDSHLAVVWHVAQANPAPHGDRRAGDLVECIGREIIRRWLAGVEPELWRHQGRDYYWSQLCELATYQPGSPDFDDGQWIPRASVDDEGAAGSSEVER